MKKEVRKVRQRSLLCVAGAVIGLCVVTFAVAEEVHSPIKQATHIPAQELAPALQALARDRHFQIVYVSEEISGRSTQGAVGEFTPEEALTRLLEGTGFTFKDLDDKTVTIVAATQAAPSESPKGIYSPPTSTAQGVPPETAIEPAQPPQVTIEAQREALRQRVSHFVRTVTTQVSSYESLARWGVKVCPSTAGLSAQQDEFIVQRISTIARSAGIPVGDTGCKPNLRVMITSDPARLIKQMWSDNPNEFADLSGQRATATEVRRFMEDPRPIRAWYGVELVGAMGNVLGPYSEMPNQGRAPRVNRLPSMSRIRNDDLQSIRSILVVVDKGRVMGQHLGAVADYVALVGLAEVNLAGDYSSAESILSLFTEPENGKSITELSAWDAAFLKALYATDQSSKFHFTEIVERMMKDPETVPVTPGVSPR